MGLRLRGGVWYLRKMIDGKRVELSTGYPESEKKRAAARAVKLVAELLDQKNGLAPKKDESKPTPTFGEWWETYYKVYSAKKADPGKDLAMMRHWLDMPLGKRTWRTTPLDQITKTDCEAALAYRREQGTQNHQWKEQRELSEGSLNRVRGLVQAVLERAVEDGTIARNPWKGVGREPESVRERLLLPDDEVKLLAVMAPRYRRFVSFVLETGLRLAEVQKINFDADLRPNGTLHVNGKGRKRKTICTVCKRMGGKCREVPLTSKARAILDEQMKAEGRLWTEEQKAYRYVMQRATEKAKLLHLSPHDLRHTFGHRWLKNRGSIKTLSKVLGHSSVAITDRHYAHLLQEDINAEMMAVMERTA